MKTPFYLFALLQLFLTLNLFFPQPVHSGQKSFSVDRCSPRLKRALLGPMASKRRRHGANRLALEETGGGGGPLEAYSQAWADYLARLVPYQPPLPQP